uniref:Uncharacterized protein n=1 Tax=Setaria italica TaxID=4555 RepID=K4A4L7_SETIT
MLIQIRSLANDSKLKYLLKTNRKRKSEANKNTVYLVFVGTLESNLFSSNNNHPRET